VHPASPPRIAPAALVLALIASATLPLAGCGGGEADDRSPPPLISLEAPRGEVHATPELFAWQPVDGAASYRVTIDDADTVWPLVVATTTDARFPLPPGKRGAILPGRIHEWTVEALDARGAVIGSGTVRFWVGRGAPGSASYSPGESGTPGPWRRSGKPRFWNGAPDAPRGGTMSSAKGGSRWRSESTSPTMKPRSCATSWSGA
jgi:hypothetical protein